MFKVITAEYDAEERILQLAEPLDNMRTGDRVRVSIERIPDESSRPWLALRGCLPTEVAAEWRRILSEAAAPDEP